MRRYQLHRDNNRGVGYKSQGCQVLAFEVQADGLLQVPGDLVQGIALGDDGISMRFGHISRLLPGTDDAP